MGENSEPMRRGETLRQRDKWRHAYRQVCRRVYGSQKNVEKSLTDRAQRDDRRESAKGLALVTEA
jgi:hypothetical protein